MIFSGDLEKFNSADLLMFLGQMGKEGLLTVTFEDETVFIGIKDGRIPYAHSKRSDGKTLRTMFWRKIMDWDQLSSATKIKKETGMPAAHILEQMGLAASKPARKVLEQEVLEVLFQFFLRDKGQFHFADVLTGVDSDEAGPSCQGATLEILHRVDEWHETVGDVGPLSGTAEPTPNGTDAPDIPPDVKAVLLLAGKGRSLARI